MRCIAIKENGERCKVNAMNGGEYCYWHSPETRNERVKASKRGGINRRVPSGEPINLNIRSVDDIYKLCNFIFMETVKHENSNARSRALMQLAGLYIQLLEVGEFEERISALEREIMK